MEYLIILNLIISCFCLSILGKNNHIKTFKSMIGTFIISNCPIVNIFLLAFLLLNGAKINE
jgi:hypothetical protein